MLFVGGVSVVLLLFLFVLMLVLLFLCLMSKFVLLFGLVFMLMWLLVVEGEFEFVVYSGLLGNFGVVFMGYFDWVNDFVVGNFDGVGGVFDYDFVVYFVVVELFECYFLCVWCDD